MPNSLPPISLAQVRAALMVGSLSAAAVLLSGCSTNSFLSSGPEPLAATHLIHGSVHGGQPPISGATVTLNTVGTTGYGSAGSVLATTTTNATGGFDFGTAFTCPATPTSTYILATGGNPGLSTAGTSNAAIALVAATGDCASLGASTVVSVNEISTVAAAFALGQYFSATGDTFGAPATTQATLGMVNAMATVNNLATLSTGAANQSVARTSATLGTITAVPEFAKLNTIADILSSCVNTDGTSASPCGTIFADVTPTGGTVPTDTLQAAVLFSLNPTSNNAKGSTANIAELYSFAPGVAAFNPTLAAAPTDWTLAIQYNAGASATQTLINGANDLAIDGGGNVWLINYNTNQTATESLTELSPTGLPLANPLNGGGTAGATTLSAASPRNLAIDSSNNVFVATSSGSAYLFKYSSAGAVTSLALGSQPYGLAINGGDVYLSHNSGTTIGFEEFPGGTLASTNRYEFAYSASPLSQATYMAYATNGTIYLSLGASATSVTQASGFDYTKCTAATVCTAATAGGTYVANGGTSTINLPYEPAAAAGGYVWVPNNAGNTVTYLAPGTTTAGAGVAYGSAASLSAPRRVAVDGNNVAWLLNRGNSGVSEITTAGSVLSPVPTGTNTSPVGYLHSAFAGAVTGIATDPSGNVWVSNGTKIGDSSQLGVNSIYELVGAAAPTITPIATAVKGNTVGTKP